MIEIALSGAGLKKEASNAALMFANLQRELCIVPKKTKTGVPEQPYGDDEIYQGAWNRATWVLDAVPTARFGLGMENGLSPRPRLGIHLDYAYIILLERGGKGFMVATSGGVVCPEKYVELSRATRWTKTAGSFYAEATGCDGADWHSHATSGLVNRRGLLTQPCIDVFARRFLPPSVTA